MKDDEGKELRIRGDKNREEADEGKEGGSGDKTVERREEKSGKKGKGSVQGRMKNKNEIENQCIP